MPVDVELFFFLRLCFLHIPVIFASKINPSPTERNFGLKELSTKLILDQFLNPAVIFLATTTASTI
jgi:hypothetical protein